MATIIRQDGREKVTGAGRYTADLTMTGLLHGCFRFAGIAHARITRLDTARARALPGVFAVITQDDVPDVRHGAFVKDRTLFARDVVRWEGEAIAAVAALTPEIARAAADLIDVDFEPLPVLTDLEAAIAPGAPLVHEGWGGYEADENLVREGNEASRSSIVKGDVDAAMAAAEVVVTGRYLADGSQAAPIEPRAVIAEWRGDAVTIWSATQVPFSARSLVCETLGLPQHRVRVLVTHLGGGFGGKCEGHFEPHVAALARAAGRPVKVVFSRREEFLAPDHRREGMVIDLETGLRRDGTIMARRARVLIDNGAYSADEPYITQLALHFAVGPYRIPNLAIWGHCVYTNTQPSGSVRAPGAPTLAWALEQHMDEAAATIGMDPVELRRRNLLRDGDESATRQVMEEIRALETLESAVAAIGYGRPLPDGEAIGVACGWWPSFPGASGAYVKLNRDGTGAIVTGAQECGTGAVMTLPILAADVLGMQPEDFTIVYQDTDAGPADGGASGSQTLFNNGRAVVEAAGDVREQLLTLAEEALEANRLDLELADGAVRVKGSPERSVSIADLSATAHGGALLIGRGSGNPPPTPTVDRLGCTGRLGAESFAAPTFGTHAIRLKVDRETGVTRILEVVAAQDSGKIVNAVGAVGQVTGGVLMGIGQALTEGMQVGEDGKARNAYLLDYKLPTTADAPEIRVIFTDVAVANAGPWGSKGIGESPNVPTSGAIANGIALATGVRVRQMPATPHRVWAAMREAGR